MYTFEERSSGSIGIGDVMGKRSTISRTENGLRLVSVSRTRERSIQVARNTSHLPTPLQIYDGIINNNKFVVNLYKAK